MQNASDYTFAKAVSITGGKAYGQPDENLRIRYLVTDSRQLISPVNSLFFAIVTRTNDGHRFIPDLLAKGVRMFVVSAMDHQWLSRYPDAGFILAAANTSSVNTKFFSPGCDPAVMALQRLAAFHRSHFSCPVIAVTGSNGKTIVKEWLFQLLSDDYQIVKNPKSYNSQIGVPLSVWQISESDQLGIFEAGISDIGEMSALQKIIHPTIGIFTNIGPAHDAGFSSRREKIREKLKLFEGVDMLVYCADHVEVGEGRRDEETQRRRDAGTEGCRDEEREGRRDEERERGREGETGGRRDGERERGREGETGGQALSAEHRALRKSGLVGANPCVCPEAGRDEATAQGAGRREGEREVFTWGRGEGVDLKLVGVEKGVGSSVISVAYRGESFSFSIPFSDAASVENAMHCVGVMLLLGFPYQVIGDRMARLQPVAMRLELKEGINQCTIINDSYNTDLSSLAIALDFLNSQTRHDRSTLIISDILQTGLEPGLLYAQVASMVKSKGVNRLIGIGPAISAQAHQFEGPCSFCSDTDTFLKTFDFSLFQRETILLKGARPFAFEKLSIYLQQKDHQTILEVDLDALVHNLNVFRSHLNEGVRVMGMVKAFSYGSGSVEIASMLQYHHVDYLAVAYADEGKELRQGGIRIPIVVMNPEVRSFETLLSYGLEPEIFSMDLLRRFMSETRLGAQYQGDTQATNEGLLQPLPPVRNIHLKLDTGMHRLGFLPAETEELINDLRDNPTLRVASVFSHLAASDDAAQDDFTRQQISLFIACCDRLESGLGYSFLRHICNSAAATRFKDAQLDMVRLGVGLYGISGDPVVRELLQQVSTFRSVISQVKHISKGSSVGYGRACIADSDMTIAIVPVGYADGLNRRLGNGRGSLLISGQPRPIIGHISMDMCTVDVTGLAVSAGDEVVIFGKERTVQDLACDLDTIPYEVLTSVSHRVKRVYVQG